MLMAAIRVSRRKDDVARRHFAHGLRKRIATAVRIPLRRQEISTLSHLPICLVLVDPPVTHGKFRATA
jgi:hypothetical protein